MEHQHHAPDPQGVENEAAPVLFSKIDATGRFIRDTAVSGLLHRGMSYREAQALGSLHICVDGNRVSAHLDQYSPLNHRRDRRFRYSLGGVMAHWVEDVVARQFRRILGRTSQDHCNLECEIVWVPDAESGVEPDAGSRDEQYPAGRDDQPPVGRDAQSPVDVAC